MIDKYKKLKGRTEEKNKSAKSSGNYGNRILELPEGTEFFKPVEGKNAIEILPFFASSKKHPDVANNDIQVGDPDYLLDLWVHRGIGISKTDDFLCLRKNYNKHCPICEEMDLLRQNGADKEMTDAFKPKRQVCYNVLDHSDGKVKVFIVSHFLFEKELQDEVSSGDELVTFSHPTEGKTIKFRARKKTMGKREFFEFKSFSFEEREETLTEKILKQALDLDQFLNVVDYEKMKKVFHCEEENQEEKEEEEEKPVRKKEIKSPKERTAGPEEDDEEDDEEDEEKPVKKEVKKEIKSKCPHGHAYGKDTDEYPECDTCKVWDDCIEEKEK